MTKIEKETEKDIELACAKGGTHVGYIGDSKYRREKREGEEVVGSCAGSLLQRISSKRREIELHVTLNRYIGP